MRDMRPVEGMHSSKDQFWRFLNNLDPMPQRMVRRRRDGQWCHIPWSDWAADMDFEQRWKIYLVAAEKEKNPDA